MPGKNADSNPSHPPFGVVVATRGAPRAPGPQLPVGDRVEAEHFRAG